ncbi:Fic family protein [Candidatus Saccharibacteria bacterium]|nr:Fic family protein [Candidatus Saccharibacteria bacterium]
MKIPETPPNIHDVISETFKENREVGIEILSRFQPTDWKGKYLHWGKLKYLEPPKGFTSEQWWAGVKTARQKLYKELEFFDKTGRHFNFAIPDCVLQDLLWLEQHAAGSIKMDQAILEPESRNTYLVSSLFDEAINSSQMEGAATTYNDAREMLRQDRKPTDTGEQMILNNYRAMRFINEFKDEKLTPEMVLQLHRILVENTLKHPENAGRFRTSKDNVTVVDSRDNTILHNPPEAKTLPDRLKLICRFANDRNEKLFIPVPLKAIILHFMLGYDHPFVDGNGRTARALFYWLMAKNNYWMMKYTSISRVLKSEFGQYKNSFLYVETDDNDLTYFIIHQLSVIRRSINRLNQYLKKKSQEIESTRELLEGKSRLAQKLNYRQLSLLRHALEHPHFMYTIESHKNSHGIYYDTARRDLLALSEDYSLLEKEKSGRAYVFLAPVDLRKRIAKK